MKVILDEGVPRQLAGYLTSHDVVTVPQVGWSGVKNGELLGLIEAAGYRAFVSCDQNIPLPQGHLKRRPFATLLLSTNHWPTMEPQVGTITDAIDRSEPGQVTAVECGKFVPRKFRPTTPRP